MFILLSFEGCCSFRHRLRVTSNSEQTVVAMVTHSIIDPWVKYNNWLGSGHSISFWQKPFGACALSTLLWSIFLACGVYYVVSYLCFTLCQVLVSPRTVCTELWQMLRALCNHRHTQSQPKHTPPKQMMIWVIINTCCNYQILASLVSRHFLVTLSDNNSRHFKRTVYLHR